MKRKKLYESRGNESLINSAVKILDTVISYKEEQKEEGG